MFKIGYALSSEEHAPQDLIRYARRAEQAGFDFAVISDHYHPWIDRQGHSSFVWSVVGGIARTIERLPLGTSVTCPTMRIHPAIIAQAAATVALMMPAPFFLGVGTGENLNEHVLGGRWPPIGVRLEMLEEAIGIIRLLWKGGWQSHRGRHFTVEDARIYSLPEKPPAIIVAAGGSKSAELAGRIGDGLISVSANSKLVKKFVESGGAHKPRYGQIAVCWSKDEEQARRTALEWWPITALPGRLFTEIRHPAEFAQLGSLITEDMIAQKITCGPDPERHCAAIMKYAKAGFDHAYIHQIGPEQEGFFRFYESEVLPRLRERLTTAA